MRNLLITSCTAKKSSAEGLIPAREMYLGTGFRASIAESERTDTDLILISAEYGVISPDTMMSYYDTVLKGSVPTKDECKHRRIVLAGDKNLQALVTKPLEEAILRHLNIIVFLPSHYLRVVENGLNPHINRCRFRVLVKRPSNMLFSQAVLAGDASIAPSRKYQDVLGAPVVCRRCSKELRDSDKVQLRSGRLLHVGCRP